MKNDTMISIRVNKETKEKASLVAQSAGMSLSGVFKALMIQMAEKKIIPFEIQSTISNVSVLHPASTITDMTHKDLIEQTAKEVISENIESFKELAK